MSRLGLLIETHAMTSTIWTSERTQHLISLWKTGRTAACIADILGLGVSRCAVLGKVYRLGLARGPQARDTRLVTATRAKSQRDENPVSPPAARLSGPHKARRASRSLAASLALPHGPTATILSVRTGQCRWPYGCSGEVGFGLCGRSVGRGAFCLAHAQVAYQKWASTTEAL